MSTPKQRVLVVDDEPQITRVLRTGLASHGYDVRTASDGDEAFEAFASWEPDLVVTDLSMPRSNGLELCRRIRSVSNVPVIVLSVKGEERTKVDALDAGADDYVTKPFGMDELMARIRATLRRVAPPALEAATIEAGDFSVDLEARTVEVRGTPVRLTPKEFELLVFLIRNAGKVLTHQVLLKAVWGGGHSEQVEYLRVFVGQLRKKVELDPSHPAYVLTEPWIGYRFDPGDRR
jgi:two-component system, OmpR family, KDP operon response regulator KdpE